MCLNYNALNEITKFEQQEEEEKRLFSQFPNPHSHTILMLDTE